MHRALFPCILILTLAACDEKAGPAGPLEPVQKTTRATTGVRKIQDAHAELAAEIMAQEARVEKGEPVEKWLVKEQMKFVDVLITAAKKAQDEEARLDAKHRLTRMRKELGQMQAERQKHYAEIAQIRKYLEGEKTGVGGIPPGFTAEELRDRLGDRQEAVRETDKKMKALTADLAKAQELVQLETVPTTEDNIYTRELEALRLLKGRIQAVLDRLK